VLWSFLHGQLNANTTIMSVYETLLISNNVWYVSQQRSYDHFFFRISILFNQSNHSTVKTSQTQ
jgi:hypothetical protein